VEREDTTVVKEERDRRAVFITSTEKNVKLSVILVLFHLLIHQ